MRATAGLAQQVRELFELPFMDLLFQAQQVHRENFTANKVQLSSLLSIKTGACPRTAPIAHNPGTTTLALRRKTTAYPEIVEAAKSCKG
ncbi:MAG: hypothetical protein ACFHHU_13425 [Porticoccaceae bacterium]